MDNSQDRLTEISEQLKAIDSKVNILQDMLYGMKNELNLIKKSRIQENYFSHMPKIAEDLEKFLDNRPGDCNILDYCTTLTEKGIFRVIRTLLEKGEEEAIIKIDKYLKFSESDPASKACPDRTCLINAMEPFRLLKELIIDSKELSSRYFEELTLLEEEPELEEVNKELINNMLTPLSNVIRLQILKYLSKGGKYYTQLEELTGIKAGHLLFHIEKLMSAKFVIQENKKYLITMKGRKALSLISGLKKELSLKS
ncbi:MAG: winged helix-turn-helix domain-containing protein [Promethearchaeota archaeon]